ncbi:MAG: hypothetical protein IPL79_12200 [Myxococcales bacterium]|nr:hypothetical protein [Myxococcales bacterium]
MRQPRSLHPAVLLVIAISAGCSNVACRHDSPAGPAASTAGVAVAPINIIVELAISDPSAMPAGFEPRLREALAGIASRRFAQAIPFFEASNYETQRQLGVGESSYIMEGLGLSLSSHVAGPVIYGAGGLPNDELWARLGKITVTGVQPSRDADGRAITGLLEVTGDVLFLGGSLYALRLQFRETAAGWVIAPPLG